MSDGLLIVDKPRGVTSFDAVAAVRGALHTKKVGHAGTLDPMATGMLVIGFGRATRLLQYIVEHDKTYEATIRLGAATTTDDAEGELIVGDGLAALEPESLDAADSPESDVSGSFRSRRRELSAEPAEGGPDPHSNPQSIATRYRALIERTIADHFLGDIEQVPNTFSAIKIDGKRAYDLAREGKDVELKARPVHIADFTVLDMRPGLASATIAGTPLIPAALAPATSAPGDSDANDDGLPADVTPALGDARSRRRELSAEPTEGGLPDEARIDPLSGTPVSIDPSRPTDPDTIPVIDVDVRVTCSSGTYIRALARDLGAELGVGGHLTRLRRTRVGRFALTDDRSGLATTVALPSDASVDATAIDTAPPASASADASDADVKDVNAAETIRAVTAHTETKTFTNREGETITRNKCVLDTPEGLSGEARTAWLVARSVPMGEAARGAMPVVEIDAAEARELRFGRRIEHALAKGVHAAAIVPAHRNDAGGTSDGIAAGVAVAAADDVVAIVERANAHQAKPVVVFPAE